MVSYFLEATSLTMFTSHIGGKYAQSCSYLNLPAVISSTKNHCRLFVIWSDLLQRLIAMSEILFKMLRFLQFSNFKDFPIARFEI